MLQNWTMHIKKLLFVLIIFVIITSLSANAQTTNGITATTNRPSYQPGDKVIITGSVENVIPGLPVTILVRNPINNVYDVGQVNLLNNIFVHDFVISDNSNAGTYVVDIKHGNQAAQIKFVVNVGPVLNIPVESNFIKVRSNGTGLINYKNVQVSTQDNSITMDLGINAASGTNIPQEFQIPKEVIDASGTSLVVQTDGANLQCEQSETNSENILDCEIPSSAKVLKIIGTSVIPEFGSATLVLISIITVMIFFTRIKLR